MRKLKRAGVTALCTGLIALGIAAPARAAAPNPDYVFFVGTELADPCGLAVGPSGGLLVSNHYRHRIDLAEYDPVLGSKLKIQPFSFEEINAPCGLAFDSAGRLYANIYHEKVERFTPGAGPLPTLIDSSDPTGVAVDPGSDNVYVNARTHVVAYDSLGNQVLDIGNGSLGDGYGLAISGYPATAGHVYVPDYADNTIKVYDPAVDLDDPVSTIDGSDTPAGGFGSLRDSAIAVDNANGQIYVADTLLFPRFTENPQAVVHVFNSAGAYQGRLKFNIVDGSPPGLAVDNSGGIGQGRVYVTSGNTVNASIYAYPAGSATSVGAPATFSLALKTNGSGDGSIVGERVGLECDAICEADISAGAEVRFKAVPEQGSAFAGWSGGGCSGTGTCTVAMSQARSVSAEFVTLAAPDPADSWGGASASTDAGASAIAQKGTLRVAVAGKLSPRRLPRDGTAPISVSVGGKISTTDETLPPQLETLRIELNRHGHLDPTGLPACKYDRIQPGSTSRALSACRSSLVGQGSFTANITLAGQEPYPTKGRLLLFNSVRGGKPVLYGHIFSPHPFATSFVIVFKVQKAPGGTYGTALTASLPEAMDAWGRLTSLTLTLSRRYSYRGEPHSYVSAGCPAPKGFPGAVFPLARTSFSFEGGEKLSSVLTSSCKARG